MRNVQTICNIGCFRFDLAVCCGFFHEEPRCKLKAALAMRADSRLARMLRVLLHMAHHDGLFTSAQIGRLLQTNPAVVRRTLAGLRTAGIVSTVQGSHGGWLIACDLQATTVLEVYRALGETQLFAVGIGSDDPDCVVERIVNHTVGDALARAQAQFEAALAAVTLADLAARFDSACREAGRTASALSQSRENNSRLVG
jgi:DNA-binding IscR family transcriptional regulator